jgi:hypothetical protein
VKKWSKMGGGSSIDSQLDAKQERRLISHGHTQTNADYSKSTHEEYVLIASVCVRGKNGFV